jgi:hypothetical protein
MGTSRVRTLCSLIRVSGANGSAVAEGDVFEGCTQVKPESHFLIGCDARIRPLTHYRGYLVGLFWEQ